MTQMTAHNGEVRIAYETIGPAEGHPILLISGGGGVSMLGWWAGFIDELLTMGFQVTRFDNRDAGHSTHFTDLPAPGPIPLLLGNLGVPPRSRVPYHLEDMADDSLAVLDAAGWNTAHVVGSSLGGAVAQTVALCHPERVRSLTLLSSVPADFRRTPAVGVAVRAAATLAYQRLRGPASRASDPQMTPELMEETAVRMFTTGPLSSPDYPADEDMVRRAVRAEWEYSPLDPAAASRQIAALVASGSRLAALRTLRVPTLVIHGDADPNVPLRGGQALARAIPRARLLTFSGMGHGVPHELWPDVAKAIAGLALRADQSPSP